jgi:hypothetical protein
MSLIKQPFHETYGSAFLVSRHTAFVSISEVSYRVKTPKRVSPYRRKERLIALPYLSRFSRGIAY